ncbi:MAG: DUF3562 domain-containing protein [Gammaproteobacteria bacterium]|jgi:Protein of unknown function (DUF3562)|nr:DUF3562 domain-containing protein [Gammaproteobacteria bacterium]
MHALHLSNNEYRQHASAITSIAGHYHIDEPVIRELYEREFEELQNHARIKIYLSVIAMRHVKDIIIRL